MNWVIVVLLLNGSGGGISGSIETGLSFRDHKECNESLKPIRSQFSAGAERALRDSGQVKKGDSSPRLYKNIQWLCFPKAAQSKDTAN